MTINSNKIINKLKFNIIHHIKLIIFIIIIIFCTLVGVYTYKGLYNTVNIIPQQVKFINKNVLSLIKTHNVPNPQYHNKYYNKQMPLYLRDFYIAGSSKSYLLAGQSFAIPSLDAIKTVLKTNARVLELDIGFNGDSALDKNAKPVVTSPNTLMPYFGKGLNFDEVIKVISENGFSNKMNCPLILFLKLNYNPQSKILEDQIATSINIHLGNRLLNKKYSYNRGNYQNEEDICSEGGTLGDISLKDAIDRVIIMVNKYPPDSMKFQEIINAVASNNDQRVHILEYTSDNEEFGGISATVTDTKSMIENNKYMMTIVEMQQEKTNNPRNIIHPTIDTKNLNPTEVRKYGNQITMMHYYKLDDNLKTELNFFTKSGLILKPDNLRCIPIPPKSIKKQNIQKSFAPTSNTIAGIGGKQWFKFNF